MQHLNKEVRLSARPALSSDVWNADRGLLQNKMQMEFYGNSRPLRVTANRRLRALSFLTLKTVRVERFIFPLTLFTPRTV